jgi:hypothetical protein
MQACTIDAIHPADWEAVRRIYLEGLAGGHATRPGTLATSAA